VRASDKKIESTPHRGTSRTFLQRMRRELIPLNVCGPAKGKPQARELASEGRPARRVDNIQNRLRIIPVCMFVPGPTFIVRCGQLTTCVLPVPI